MVQLCCRATSKKLDLQHCSTQAKSEQGSCTQTPYKQCKPSFLQNQCIPAIKHGSKGHQPSQVVNASSHTNLQCISYNQVAMHNKHHTYIICPKHDKLQCHKIQTQQTCNQCLGTLQTLLTPDLHTYTMPYKMACPQSCNETDITTTQSFSNPPHKPYS